MRDYMLEAMKVVAQYMKMDPVTQTPDYQKEMITLGRIYYMQDGSDATLCNALARLTAFGL